MLEMRKNRSTTQIYTTRPYQTASSQGIRIMVVEPEGPFRPISSFLMATQAVCILTFEQLNPTLSTPLHMSIEVLKNTVRSCEGVQLEGQTGPNRMH